MKKLAFRSGMGTLVTAALAVTFSWFYQPRFLLKVVNLIAPGIVMCAPNDRGYFALTFDDGPNPPYTDEVLAILDRYGAQATFFFMGTQVEKHPGYVDMVLARGHEIGNHMYSSKAAVFMSDGEFERSIHMAERAFGGLGSRFLRPAGALARPGAVAIAESLGYKMVLGSAYASDWLQRPLWYMRWAYRSMLRSGSIVILHDGRGNRTAALKLLPEILESARQRGLVSVTLGTLIESASSLKC